MAARSRPGGQPWQTHAVQYPQPGLSTPDWAKVEVYQGGKLIDKFAGGIGVYRIPPIRTKSPVIRQRHVEATIRAAERRSREEASRRARRTQPRSRPGAGTPGNLLVRLGKRSYFQTQYRGPQTLGTRPGTTSFGQKTLDLVSLQKKWQAQQTPLFGGRRLGGCVETTLLRMKLAHQAAYGKDLLAGKSRAERETYDAVAGSRSSRPAWKKVPRRYRYKGAPGGLAYLGLADVVEGKDFWAGKADPGAPIQTWTAHPGGPGHSAILERYLRDERGRVRGIVISDQHFNYKVIGKPRKGDASKYIGARYRDRN